MITMRQDLMINGLGLLLGLGAAAVAVWAVLSGQVGKLGIDGLFLLVVCLLFAFAFLLSPLGAIRTALRERQAQRAETKTQGEN
jgi:hypothetical protein